uniref:Fungal N-terminal domain-containing protein n=1 Tax=Mycena chlorophos TaxID=658473 RepID=A0ABQ0LYZ5_MYCCL|nr:predicted protein [Mycena chlorophos]
MSAPAMPIPQPAPAPVRHDSTNAALDIAQTVLQVLGDIASLGPGGSYLQGACQLALNICNTAQVKNNKEDFTQLATDACELVYVIAIGLQTIEDRGMTVSPSMQAWIGQLEGTLNEIYEFARAAASKKMGFRWFRNSTQSKDLTDYRTKLRQALDKFGLQSQMSIHESVVAVEKELREYKIKRDREAQASAAPSPSRSSTCDSSSTFPRSSPPLRTPPPPEPSQTFTNSFGDIRADGGNIKITAINGNHNVYHHGATYNNISNSFNNYSGGGSQYGY